MMKRLAALLLMTWLTPLAVSGCEEAEVKRYRAPKDEAPPPLVSEHVTGGAATPRATGGAMRSAASAGPQRLLAAIVPRDDQVWFVKLMGPAALVDAEAPRFAQLIESLRFAGDEGGGHPTWSTPQGWRLGAESAGRFATLILPTDPPLETTISALPPHSGDLLSNVNRWRGQLGLRPTGTPALPTMTREIELNGVSATLVDLRSEGGGVAAPMPREVVAPPTDTAAAPGGKPITYTTPEGWTEQPGEGMRLAWWTIAEGGGQRTGERQPLAAAGGPGAVVGAGAEGPSGAIDAGRGGGAVRRPERG